MVAPIAVRLGIFNIILFSDYRDIVLLGKRLRQPVNIVHVGADYPYSRHIIEILLHIVHSKIKSLAMQLIHNTGAAL